VIIYSIQRRGVTKVSGCFSAAGVIALLCKGGEDEGIRLLLLG
jgi:hypothetical protein